MNKTIRNSNPFGVVVGVVDVGVLVTIVPAVNRLSERSDEK